MDPRPNQRPDQLVYLADWASDPEFPIHPFGSREKSVFVCPTPAPFPFLLPGHRYLFKLSNPRGPSQFWSEIIAYQIGEMMGIEVPPAFVGVNSEGQPGALMEFFYGHDGSDETLEHGGDYWVRFFPGYDRRKGRSHSIQGNLDIGRELRNQGLICDPVDHWSELLLLDALIGNTDRHQDNWGVVWRRVPTSGNRPGRYAPAFDNGTSLIPTITRG